MLMLWRCIWWLAVSCHIAMATVVHQANGGVDIEDMFREFIKEIDDLKTVVRHQDARIIGLERRLEVAEAIIRGDKGQPLRADEHTHGLPVLTSPFSKDSSNHGTSIRDGETVAFTAYLDHEIKPLGPERTIKYTHTYLNSGNAYNTFSGVFTVPSSGIYFFSISINSFINARTILRLMVDGKPNIYIISDPVSSHSSMGYNSVVLQLVPGQAVWVETDTTTTAGDAFGGPFSLFTGFLIK